MNTKILSIAAAAGLLIGLAAVVQAHSRDGMGTSTASPRHEMKQPRAGGAPRHSAETTGAGGAGDRDDFTTGSAGRLTTGSAGRDDDDVRPRHDTDGMDNDRRGIDKD